MNSFPEKTLQDLNPKRRFEVELRGRSTVVLVVEAKVDQFVRRGSSMKRRRPIPEAALPVLQELAVSEPGPDCTPDAIRAARALLEFARGATHKEASVLVGRPSWYSKIALEWLLKHGHEAFRKYKNYKKSYRGIPIAPDREDGTE
jgi:hypothetical protein